MRQIIKRVESLESLLELQREYAHIADFRTGRRREEGRREVLICGDTGCVANDSTEVVREFNRQLAAEGLEDQVQVSVIGCFGFCVQGPIVKIMPDNTMYVKVKPEDVSDIVHQHLLDSRRVKRLLYHDPSSGRDLEHSEDFPFYKKQKRVVMRNLGLVHPEKMEESIAFRGYEALARSVCEKTPQEVIDIVRASGLRGRGGAGFPTGLKWQAAADQPGDVKYIVCNADEGDPGAFMDRAILEGDPNSVLEAMAIAGYAIGAHEGIIYIRAEYPSAIHRLKLALTQAHQYGFLGKNIFGSGFDFDITLRYGAGAFVCGEETALLHSIEGGRGEPTPKPPFPFEHGLYGKPTIINNVETLANIPAIMLEGAEWFSSIGTPGCTGTKVFCLAGKVRNVGLVEVPMGTTLREIIFDIGGGIRDDKRFKAVQTGGPSGGCIPESHLDTPIDYDSLKALGSIMGSGGMIVMDQDNCMVDVAKFFLEFTIEESCGKCAPCRVGTKRLHELLSKVTSGRATDNDLDLLEEFGQTICASSLCGLGQSAPNPVLSTLRYFREEYEQHVHDHHCAAEVCIDLMEFEITDACIGCNVCKKNCPVSCIDGAIREKHHINQADCIKCGSCMSICPVGAIIKK